MLPCMRATLYACCSVCVLLCMFLECHFRTIRALYALLLAPELPHSSKVAPMFLSLLFKAVKADHRPQRVAAMAKRLLQVAAAAPAHFAAGALLITSELVKVGQWCCCWGVVLSLYMACVAACRNECVVVVVILFLCFFFSFFSVLL